MRRPHFLTPLVDAPGRRFVLNVEGRPSPLATSLDLASDSASRRRGLLGRDDYPRDAVMIIAPCNAVHTFFMRFPIDIVFAARDGRIMKTRHAVPPWRIVMSLRAFATLEFAAGVIDEAGLQVGDRMMVSPRA